MARSYIEEMFFLCRAFAIEQGADLSKSKVVWTYPLSMRGVDEMHESIWERFYDKYFKISSNSEDRGSDELVQKVTESIAPLMYYAENNKMLSADMEMSVDIGGGTCDVVMKDGNETMKINSFRFAADVIFGAGIASENRMIKKWSEKFIVSLSDKLKKNFIEMLKSVCRGQQPSSEANSLLFSLETLPELSGKADEDKSYNMNLKTDNDFKVVFLYFYGAIIYYLSNLIKQRGFSKQPGTIYFSGTGSKLLSIIGNKTTLEELTSRMFEIFGGFRYDRNIRIIIEANEPKQLTAKGALSVLSNDRKKTTEEIYDSFLNKNKLKENVIFSSLLEKDLTFADLKKDKVIKDVIGKVDEFNQLFMTCVKELDFEEEYCCGKESIKLLINNIDRDLLLFLKSEIDEFPESDSDDEILCESLFFYPIKKIIQNFIIEE